MDFSEVIEGACQGVFSPDSNWFAIAGNLKIIVKNTQTLNTVLSFTLPDFINNFQFSPDSTLIFAVSSKRNYIEIRSLLDEQWSCKINDQAAGIQNARFAPDSRSIITFSEFQIKASIFSLVDSSESIIKNPKFNDKATCFTSDGNWMAMAEKRATKEYIGIYSTQDWKLVDYIELETQDLQDIQWTPDNGHIIVWDSYLNYQLIIIAPGKGKIKSFQPYQFALGIKSVSISPNSQLVAIGSYDEKIRLLNCLTWNQVIEFEHNLNQKNLNQHKNLIIFNEEEHKDPYKLNQTYFKYTMVDQIKNQSQKIGIKDQEPNSICEVQWSYDSNFLATLNNGIPNALFIWEVNTLELKSIINHINPIKQFAWAKTGNQLVLVTGKNRIFLWNPDGASICDIPMEGKPFNINSFEWSSNSRSLLLHDKNDSIMAYPSIEIIGQNDNEEQII